MPLLRAEPRRAGAHRRRAAPTPGPLGRLRAAARALRRWWVEDRHYRPERRYMRG